MNTSSHVDTLIKQAAQTLSVEEVLLRTWLNATPYLTPDQTTCLLHLIHKYQLDPWCEELVCYRTEDQELHIMITMNGWYKIINQQTSFAGMSLREATTLTDGIPDWMECCIYRHDRILPIVVKEYLAELETPQEAWQKMPRRMLRHRTIQQCARLAFGISTPDIRAQTEYTMNPPMTSDTIHSQFSGPKQSRTEVLRAVLEKTSPQPLNEQRGP